MHLIIKINKGQKFLLKGDKLKVKVLELDRRRQRAIVSERLGNNDSKENGDSFWTYQISGSHIEINQWIEVLT